MNILFVCSQNKRRSLTAEKIIDGYNGNKVRSEHLRRLKENYSDEMTDRVF